jgi:hypothetical protein
VAEQLVQARDAAEAADRAKSAFLANVSHELRTPLNGVQGVLQLLDGTPSPADTRELVATAQASAGELLGLIDRLLEYVRLESAVAPDPAGFDLAALAREVLALAGPAAAAKRLTLTLDCAEGFPAHIVSVREAWGVALRELLLNAIKFTARGGVAVRLAVQAGGGVEVMVCDSGVGIAAGDVGRLFGELRQLDESSTRRHGGLGLGLALCRRAMQRVGGQVAIASTSAQGTCFALRLGA